MPHNQEEHEMRSGTTWYLSSENTPPFDVTQPCAWRSLSICTNPATKIRQMTHRRYDEHEGELHQWISEAPVCDAHDDIDRQHVTGYTYRRRVLTILANCPCALGFPCPCTPF